MASSTAAITRFELGSTFHEFDHAMNQRGFIGPRVLRPRVVGLQAADVGKVPIEQLLVIKDTERKPGSGYKRGDFEFTTFQYATDEHGWEEPMDDRQLAIFEDMIDAEQIHSARASNMVLQNYEIDVAAAIYNTTTFSSLTTAVTDEWDDATNGIPIDDVHAAIESVATQSGLEANALVINRNQLRQLQRNNQIVDRIKYWGGDDPKEITGDMLAACFDLDMVIVAGGLKNTANEGATASIARVWDNEYAMVCRVATTDDPREPCIGRTFVWGGDGPGAPGDDQTLAIVVEEYRDEAVRGNVLRARNDRDIVIMYAEAGHLLSNITT